LVGPPTGGRRDRPLVRYMKRLLRNVLRRTPHLVVAGAVAVVLLSFVLGRRRLPYEFVDRTEETGLLFHHISGREGQRWTIEQTGTGMGLIDGDNDGWLDVYFSQGHYLPGSEREQEAVGNEMYHNNADGTFTEATAATRTGDRGYGQGVAVGDYNNDGWDDICVTNYGLNVLYRNNGNGTFSDVTEEAGLNLSPYADAYANSCGFFDYDLDGLLDLYIVNYSNYLLETHEDLYNDMGFTVYRGPPTIQGQQDILYHNNGDGTFTDVTIEAGVNVRRVVQTGTSITCPRGRGMAFAFPDVNNDGWPDIFVGNDSDLSFLFVNNRDGTFTGSARDYGVDRCADGLTPNLMGIDYCDLNDDGIVDFVASNFQGRSQELYVSQQATGAYKALSLALNLGSVTRSYLTWGTGLVDLDNDGDCDLFIAAGHVLDNAEIVLGEPVQQSNLIFENRFNEGGDFTDVTELAGPGMELVKWSRAALFGDLDNDGDIDVIVGNLNERCDVLTNDWKEGVEPNNWITFDLRGTISNRNALGARLYLTAGDLKLMGDCKATFSYLCSNDRRVHFGLGKETRVDTLEVHWPSGIVTTYQDLPVNQFVTLTEPNPPPPGTQLRRLKPRAAR